MGRTQKQCSSFCVQYIASTVLFKEADSWTLKRWRAIDKKYSARPNFCWSQESQWNKIGTWLWNGMTELAGMPGMFQPSESVDWEHPTLCKRVGGTLKGHYCVSMVLRGTQNLIWWLILYGRWPTQGEKITGKPLSLATRPLIILAATMGEIFDVP